MVTGSSGVIGGWRVNLLAAKVVEKNILKGTVIVVLSGIPFLDSHVRFKTVPCKPLSGQQFGRSFL